MLAESKKAIDQAERVGRLTQLAFFNIPISFTTSFFGMNFKQLNSGTNLSTWIWFVVSFPRLVISILVLGYDVSTMLNKFLKHHYTFDWIQRAFG